MPKKHFTETNLTAIPHGATTWYSHDGDKYAGLRLCVTQTAKTWYVSKWDIEAQKTRAINIGRFPAYSLDAAWKKAQAEIGKIDRGEMNRPAPEGGVSGPRSTRIPQRQRHILAFTRVETSQINSA